MKNFLFIIFFMTSLLFGLKTSAQVYNANAQFKNGESDLRKFLVDRFNSEAKNNKINACSVSAIFAKFRIDSLGNIKDVYFSTPNDAPQAFRNILHKIIVATNGAWLPSKVNDKPTTSKPFILPLIFEMEAGCNLRSISSGTKAINKETPNTLNISLLHILDFEDNVDNKNNQLDCIILKPLTIYSQK